MENNDLIKTPFEEKKESLIDEDEILEPQPECCIYKVPTLLRKINEAAYTPQVISIGPLHHGKGELIDMEKQKIRYKREFRKRITFETWKELVTFVENKEKDIRKCYEEMPKIGRPDFITMILYDAIFIIELFLRNFERKSDFLLKGQVGTAIWEDLEVLENQIPYFIPNELYMLASPKFKTRRQTNPSFFSLSCVFLRGINATTEEVEVLHFVDLRRHVLTKTHPEPLGSLVVGVPCAVKLQQSGVKLKGIEDHGGLLDIKFEKKKIGIPWLQVYDNELQIPSIKVYDDTELFIRNVMAFEQCHYPHETHVCNYIDLMDSLINTEEDVNLLVEAGIIKHNVGDDGTVANMFNKLGKHISLSNSSCFHDIRKCLKAHYENRWNRAMATLKSVYFSNYWRGTATVAAIVLLFLTLIQTVCSILQVV